MRRVIATVALVVLAAALIAAAGGSADGSSGTQQSASECSTAIATGPSLLSAHPTFTQVGGEPFGVATTRGYAFVANIGGDLDVLADRDSAPHLIHRVALVAGLGMTITADRRYLLIADGGDGATVVSVARAEAGSRKAVLGSLRAGSTKHGAGAIEVAVSRDGRYAFVSLEGSQQIAVYRLAAAIADHFRKRAYVGAIPTGLAPVGLAVSPNGRWLYSTSELGSPGQRGRGEIGSLSVINVDAAERDPAKAVVATTSAGCNPVRVAVSPDGNDVWVTARASDELLAFSASKLRDHANDAELASVRVGEAPVGVAVLDGGTRVVVADSNRFGASGRTSALTVVDATRALRHQPAIVGTIKAEQFPRDVALEPAGTVLLISNFGSGVLESVHI